MGAPLSELSDLELIAAHQRGDERAFAVLYHRHKQFVFNVAFRFCGEHAAALDALQDVFAHLAETLPTLQLTARMTTYLYTVTRSCAVTQRRKRARFVGGEELVEEDLPALPVTDADNQRAEFNAVLATLPVAHREVLLMRFVDDLSLEEIAAALDVPLGTVKSRLHHAIAKLRENPRLRAYFEA